MRTSWSLKKKIDLYSTRNNLVFFQTTHNRARNIIRYSLVIYKLNSNYTLRLITLGKKHNSYVILILITLCSSTQLTYFTSEAAWMVLGPGDNTEDWRETNTKSKSQVLLRISFFFFF